MVSLEPCVRLLIDTKERGHMKSMQCQRRTCLLALFICGLFGCDGDSEITKNDVVVDSTFTALQVQLFDGQGCSDAACHGVAAAGDLDLRAGTAYGQLVSVQATGSTLNRVEPGDRNRSYLFQKLLAATDPESARINGAAMPTGRPPIPAALLQALRLWIYAGSPETGTVDGTAELLGTPLPDPTPYTIAPLPKPDPAEGLQLEMPPWLIPAGTEREVCFASYIDLRDSVPDAVKDETGEYALTDIKELRQDPQSHHLIVNISRVPIEDIHDPSFGDWTCRGGATAGAPCEPTDTTACGVGGHCTTAPVDGFGCIGFGPVVPGAIRSAYPIGGAQKAQDYEVLPEGVYYRVPLRGLLYWNSHAFNLTAQDHMMNGRINFMFSKEPRYRSRNLGRESVANLFLPRTPPFEKEEVCGTVTLPKGAHLFALSSHTHKRGERFWIENPNGELLYENFLYNDPDRLILDPPLIFDSEEESARTLTYCALYNNGVAADGTPDPETVTRASRMPDSVNIIGVPGACTPVACVAGKIGAACDGADDNGSCDSAPDAGDGLCDACTITGGESTENEMFLVIGDYFLMDEAE